MSQPSVSCPECPAGPYTEPGRLAGHLVEVHGQGAAVALHDARRLLAPIAAALGKPVKTIASDLLHRAGVIETKPDPKEAKMAKKKRAQQKCRICTKPGHNAKSCIEKTVVDALERPRAATLNKQGTARGPVREIAGGANGAGTKARESAKAAVSTLLHEALAEAKAYVAELERLVATA